MTNAEKAAEHVAQAEELLAATLQSRFKGGKLTREVQAALGTGHATLALYYQREADREQT